jgi:ribosomal protein S2
MAKTYAVCQIDGLIRLVNEPPREGHFALAVGTHQAVRKVVQETAEATTARRKPAHRIPGIQPNTTERANLLAIARYIQVLQEHNAHNFRALGV